MTSAARVLALPTLVTPDDVQCSRSEAYAHLRACAVLYHSRAPEARTMLRVTQVAWDRYVNEVLLCRRWDLNLRPWDYDSHREVGIASVLPAKRHKRGKGAADVQHAPVVLRVVRAGGKR